MKRITLIVMAALLALTSVASAQSYRGIWITGNNVPGKTPAGRSDMIALVWGAGVPSGTCTAASLYVKTDGSVYGCNAGTWTALAATSTTPTFTTLTTTGAISGGSTIAATTTITATTTVKGTTGVISNTAKWTSGSGAPAASCAVGDLYTRTDGSTNTTLYVCTATNTFTAK